MLLPNLDQFVILYCFRKNMADDEQNYDFSTIEKKWQDYWERDHTFRAEDSSKKTKYYALDMFPYPSGAGLHIGKSALEKFKKDPLGPLVIARVCCIDLSFPIDCKANTFNLAPEIIYIGLGSY